MVYKNTKEKHDARLKAAFKKARKYNLHFSKNKLQLARENVKFLGHYISKDEVKVADKKVEAAINMKTPSNKQNFWKSLLIWENLYPICPNKQPVIERCLAKTTTSNGEIKKKHHF